MLRQIVPRVLQPAFVVTVALSASGGCREPASPPLHAVASATQPATIASSGESIHPSSASPSAASTASGAPAAPSDGPTSIRTSTALTDEEAAHLFDGPNADMRRAFPELCRREPDSERFVARSCWPLHSASTKCRGGISKLLREDGSFFECTCHEGGNPPRSFAMYCPKHVLERKH